MQYGAPGVCSMELLVFAVYYANCLVITRFELCMVYGAPGAWSILHKLPCNHTV